MDTLQFLLRKFRVNMEIGEREINGKLPIEVPNTYRGYLAYWLKELDFKIGVEVGVASGDYSHKIMRNNPQIKMLYGIDPYISHKGYTDYTKVETFDILLAGAEKRLSKYSNYTFIKEFSMDALKRFEDNSLDFCYIDGNHSDPFVTQDVFGWAEKVRSGGILAGHDWTTLKTKTGQNVFNVKDAVYKYTNENNIRPWFVLGVAERKPGAVRERSRSWLIVKP